MKKESLPVWDLTRFYASDSDPQIATDIVELSKKYTALQKKYKGRIASLSANEIEKLLDILQKLNEKAGKVASFAMLLATTDTIKPEYGILQQKIVEWEAEISKSMLFFGIEWKGLSEKKAQTILQQINNPVYAHYLSYKRQFAPYTLKEDIEEVILEKDITGSSSWSRLFTQLTSTLQYEYKGKSLTQSEILSLVSNDKRHVRKQSAESVTKTLFGRKMELSHIFNTLVADKMMEDKRRGYKNWLTSRNLANKVSDDIVSSLVTSVTARYDIVSKHYRLKKKLLKLETLYEYDRYAPLVFTKPSEIPWSEGSQLVRNAYRQFSAEAGDVIDGFFEENYIHAALLPNKRGGAFCASTVSAAHPYILTNYMKRPDDVMTLAHELGHGLHQYLAGKTQGDYGLHMPLVTQEMASTFGEMIVFHELMNKLTNPKEKLTLLTQKIDSMIATVFRQISMHCFEDIVHTKRREGELTYEDISDAWITTQRAMFGKSVTLTDNYKGWWSYIPHFIHTPGYVYAYAFGELLALSLYKLYQKNPADFTPKYIELLKAGDSDYPVNLLKKVGVDISKKSFWEEGLQVIAELVEEETKLSKQI